MKRISRSLTYTYCAATILAFAALVVGAPHQKKPPITLRLEAPVQPLARD